MGMKMRYWSQNKVYVNGLDTLFANEGVLDDSEIVPHDKFIQYLEAYRSSDHFFQHHNMLIAALEKGYPQYGLSQTLRYEDIWKASDDSEPFWELILTLSLMTKDITLSDMNREQKMILPILNTWGNDGELMPLTGQFISVAKIEVISEKMKRAVIPRHIQTELENRASLILDDTNLLIRLSDGTKFFVGQLHYGGLPYNFIKHLRDYPNRQHNIADIHDYIDNDHTIKDLADYIGKRGFDKDLKPYFFNVSKEKIELKQDVVVDTKLLELLNKLQTLNHKKS
jgi:hypothetical protein